MSEPVEISIQLAHQALKEGLETVQECLARVKKGLDKEKYDDKLASHLIYLLRGTSGILDDLRKLVVSAKKVFKEMSADEQEEIVRSIVQEMAPQRFKAFKRWVNGLEES